MKYLRIHNETLVDRCRFRPDSHPSKRMAAALERAGCYTGLALGTRGRRATRCRCNVVIVSVPPDILDDSTSTDMEVREGSDVTLRCAATGTPKPKVMWRREVGGTIQPNSHEGMLDLAEKLYRIIRSPFAQIFTLWSLLLPRVDIGDIDFSLSFVGIYVRIFHSWFLIKFVLFGFFFLRYFVERDYKKEIWRCVFII